MSGSMNQWIIQPISWLSHWFNLSISQKVSQLVNQSVKSVSKIALTIRSVINNQGVAQRTCQKSVNTFFFLDNYPQNSISFHPFLYYLICSDLIDSAEAAGPTTPPPKTCASINGICLSTMSFIHCRSGADNDAKCPFEDQQYCCKGLWSAVWWWTGTSFNIAFSPDGGLGLPSVSLSLLII